MLLRSFSRGDLPHNNVSSSVQSPPFYLLTLIYHDLFFSYVSYKIRRHKPASTLLCAVARAVRAGARLAVRAEHKSLLEITVGGGRRAWSEILHASNATVNLTEVPACLCCLEECFLPKALKSDILCGHFYQAQCSPKSQLFSHALLVCAHFLCGQVPRESSATSSHPFLTSDERSGTLVS